MASRLDELGGELVKECTQSPGFCGEATLIAVRLDASKGRNGLSHAAHNVAQIRSGHFRSFLGRVATYSNPSSKPKREPFCRWIS